MVKLLKGGLNEYQEANSTPVIVERYKKGVYMKRLILFALISTIVFGISAITFKEALMDSKSVLCAAENAIQWELRALTDDKLGYYDLDSSKLVGQSMELDKVTEDNICGFCAETASSYIGNYDVGRIIGVTTGEGSTSWSKR